MTKENTEKTNHLIPGIYAAHVYFLNHDNFDKNKSYKSALSIGWNPVYENEEKAVEVFIIDAGEIDDFYGSELRVDIKAFFRAESLFSDFDALIKSI